MEALRYVVLRHEGVADPHYDLMFETAPDSELSTWRATEWPLEAGTPLVYLANHRRAYLEYEGPVPGNRGRVHRVHAGQHVIRVHQPSMLIVEIEDGTVLHLPRTTIK